MALSGTLSFSLTFLLLSLAGLHLYWALGGLWPGRDKDALKAKVLGGPPGAVFPSPLACLAVAAALILAAGVALRLGGFFVWLHSGWAVPCGCLLAAGFLARGLLGYRMHAFSYWKDSLEFNHWNRRLYSPLCILIALLFLGLIRAS